jgi:UDP-glucose 4-epimerase
MVSIYLAQALSSGKIIVKGSTSRYRDLIFIDDVVEAWFRATNFDAAKNQIINLGTGVKTTVDTLLQKICSLVPQAEYVIVDATPGDQNGIYADNSKLRNILKMDKFVASHEGISSFTEWVRKVL